MACLRRLAWGAGCTATLLQLRLLLLTKAPNCQLLFPWLLNGCMWAHFLFQLLPLPPLAQACPTPMTTCTATSSTACATGWWAESRPTLLCAGVPQQLTHSTQPLPCSPPCCRLHVCLCMSPVNKKFAKWCREVRRESRGGERSGVMGS